MDMKGLYSKPLSKRRFQEFVKKHPEFNKYYYGEIKFGHYGFKDIYSPFVTVSPNIEPSLIWQLFTNHWGLSVPQVVISVSGFYSLDQNKQWKTIQNNAWLLTNGLVRSSFIGNVSIAVISALQYGILDEFYSPNSEGQFPLDYQKHLAKHPEFNLDCNHTHLVFVEGDKHEAAMLQMKLLTWVGDLPIELDSTFVNFVTIPVIGYLSSDCSFGLEIMIKLAAKNHPVIVDQRAEHTLCLIEFMSNKYKNNKSVTPEDLMELTSLLDHYFEEYTTEEQKRNAVDFFKCFPYRQTMTLYPTKYHESFTLTVLELISKGNKYSNLSIFKLATCWNKLDFIKELLEKHFFPTNENDFLKACLYLGVLDDNPKLLHLLYDQNIDVIKNISIQDLTMVYYHDHRMHKLNRNLFNIILHSSISLYEVGEVLHRLTGHSAKNIYMDSIYMYPVNHAKHTITDDSTILPYPYRDIFLFCVVTDKYETAEIILQHSTNKMALCLMAASICKNMASEFEENKLDALMIQKFENHSINWEELAITMVNESYHLKQIPTTQYVNTKLRHLGSFSCLTIAHHVGLSNFIAQPPVQKTLDNIWYGKTIIGKCSFIKTLLGIFLPFLIPMLHIIKENGDSHSDDTSEKLFMNFELVDTEQGTQQLQHIKEDLVHDISVVSNELEKGKISRKKMLIKYLSTIRYFYQSARVTFIIHGIFLFIAIILMSLNVIVLNLRTPTFESSFPNTFVFYYMMGLSIDEIRQVLDTPQSSYVKKIKHWIGDSWNRLDFIMLLSYYIGIIIMWSGQTNNSIWYFAKCLLCLSLLILFVRAIQSYLVSRILGPKVWALYKMLTDTIVFLLLLILFLLSYGVISLSLQFPIKPELITNTTVLDPNRAELNVTTASDVFYYIFNNIIRIPYWNVYGELLDSMLEPITTTPEFILSVIGGLYLFLANICLVNLLIAMYSNTFQKIDDHAMLTWSYNRYHIIREYSFRPSTPPPFIIIHHVIRAIYYLSGYRSHQNNFRKTPNVDLLKFMNELECYVMKNIMEKQKEDIGMTSFFKRQEILEKKVDFLISLADIKSQHTSFRNEKNKF